MTIVRCAGELFYEFGFHATSVEQIASLAQTHKMTVYRAFASKDNIAIGYIAHVGEEDKARWELLTQAVAEHSGAAIRRWFGDLAREMCLPGYRGDALIKLATEFADEENVVRQSALMCLTARRAALQRIFEIWSARDDEVDDLLLLWLAAACPGRSIAGRMDDAGRMLRAVDRRLDELT